MINGRGERDWMGGGYELPDTMKRILIAGLLVCVGTSWSRGETVYQSFGLSRSHDLGSSPDFLDLNSDGVDDFRLSWDQSNTTIGEFGFYAPFLIKGMNGGSFSFLGSAVAVPDGSKVGPSSGWWTATDSEERATLGSFSVDSSRSWTDLLMDEGSHTLAVRFGAEGGGDLYGWIRFRDFVGDGSTEWGPQVVDFAYNSVTDQPIFSAIVPVPEPGTGALLGIGAAALAGRMSSRRKARGE
jgi:hypothetical protein